MKIAVIVEIPMLWEHYFVKRHAMTYLVVFAPMKMIIKIVTPMVAQVLQNIMFVT